MRIFIGLFEPRRIACLLESREFVVREWFRYLKRHRIEFQARLHRIRWRAAVVGDGLSISSECVYAVNLGPVKDGH
jgi:hypothetical protein